MAPHVLLAIELSGQADGSNSDTGEGVYLELGVEPGLEVVDGNIGLSFPITLGLSLSNYYENGMPVAVDPDPTFSDTFGFFSIGAAVGVPLTIMGDSYGNWGVGGKLPASLAWWLPRVLERRQQHGIHRSIRCEHRVLSDLPPVSGVRPRSRQPH